MLSQFQACTPPPPFPRAFAILSRFCGHKVSHLFSISEEQGWHSGESTHLPPKWPGFKCWRGRHMYVGWVCYWFSPLLWEVFSLGTLLFLSPQKPAFPNSNSTRNQVDEEPLCGCATSKSSFYLFSIIIRAEFSSRQAPVHWARPCCQLLSVA